MCIFHILPSPHSQPLALYKGMTFPLLGCAAINAVAFGVQAKVLALLQPGYSTPKIANSFAAGAVAGAVQSLISCPTELVKLRLQMQRHPTQFHVAHRGLKQTPLACATTHGTGEVLYNRVYSSPLHAVRQMYREGGLAGINKGMAVTLTREVPAFGAYFAIFDFMCQRIMKSRGMSNMNELSSAAIGLSGGAAGALSWLFVYPIDVVKSRIQVDGMVGARRYKGMFDCFAKSYREEGSVRVFFNGLTVCVMRGFVMEATVFVTVALVLRMWRNTTR